MSDGKIRIKILCEGSEEYKYMKKLTSFPGIFSDIYYFDEPINCKGITRIFPRYQDLFTKNLYEVILIFCDADRNSKDFQSLCSKIDNCMFGGKKVSEKIVIFVNPVTLQVVLSHIGKVKLISSSKATNENIVEEFIGIKNYRGHEEQIDEMMKLIKLSTYEIMKENISSLPQDLDKCPSTNFIEFLNYFEHNDISWINDIYKLIDD